MGTAAQDSSPEGTQRINASKEVMTDDGSFPGKPSPSIRRAVTPYELKTTSKRHIIIIAEKPNIKPFLLSIIFVWVSILLIIYLPP